MLVDDDSFRFNRSSRFHSSFQKLAWKSKISDGESLSQKSFQLSFRLPPSPHHSHGVLLNPGSMVIIVISLASKTVTERRQHLRIFYVVKDIKFALILWTDIGIFFDHGHIEIIKVGFRDGLTNSEACNGSQVRKCSDSVWYNPLTWSGVVSHCIL